MTPTQSEFAEAALARPWPAERIELWPIERLIPYTNHARLHSEADIDKLSDSIRTWGWTMPALIDEEGNLLAGQLRFAVAAKLGLKSIPVIVARGWSEAEKRAYRLADNQLAARASWDFEQLHNELRELKSTGFDLDLVGFDPTTTRLATGSASRVGGTAPRSRSNACAARLPTTAGPARRSTTRFSAPAPA
jgi:ParB-like chromosome segregation protein Spo0J